MNTVTILNGDDESKRKSAWRDQILHILSVVRSAAGEAAKEALYANPVLSIADTANAVAEATRSAVVKAFSEPVFSHELPKTVTVVRGDTRTLDATLQEIDLQSLVASVMAPNV
jgi:hypothetical protein